MKQFSQDYFEKKYRTLFNKMLFKQGFNKAIKDTRKSLGIPETGFDNEQEFALFCINKLSKQEKQILTFIAIAETYAQKHKIPLDEDHKKEIFDSIFKRRMS